MTTTSRTTYSTTETSTVVVCRYPGCSWRDVLTGPDHRARASSVYAEHRSTVHVSDYKHAYYLGKKNAS